MDAALGFRESVGSPRRTGRHPLFQPAKVPKRNGFQARAASSWASGDLISPMCQKIKRLLPWLPCAACGWRPTAVGLRQCLGHGRAPCGSIRSSFDTVHSLIVPCAAFNSDPVRHISRVPLHGGFFSGRLHRIVKMTSERQAIGDSLRWFEFEVSAARGALG